LIIIIVKLGSISSELTLRKKSHTATRVTRPAISPILPEVLYLLKIRLRIIVQSLLVRGVVAIGL